VEGAEIVAERMRQAIEAAIFEGKKSASQLTVSIGVSPFPKGGLTEIELLQDAEKSLREAKFWGKNRVVSNRKHYHSQVFLATTQIG